MNENIYLDRLKFVSNKIMLWILFSSFDSPILSSIIGKSVRGEMALRQSREFNFALMTVVNGEWFLVEGGSFNFFF